MGVWRDPPCGRSLKTEETGAVQTRWLDLTTGFFWQLALPKK
jgi:hypothetical protein